MLDSIKTIKLFNDYTYEWSKISQFTFFEPDVQEIFCYIKCLHSCNFNQWLLEDEVRKNLDNELLVSIKKKIDISNIKRNYFMELIDNATVQLFNIEQNIDYNDCYINSETIGQMIDRLSILSLKKYFIDKNMAVFNDVDEKIKKIQHQIEYISYCYDQFLKNIKLGTAYMLSYKQFKTYNKSKL